MTSQGVHVKCMFVTPNTVGTTNEVPGLKNKTQAVPFSHSGG